MPEGQMLSGGMPKGFGLSEGFGSSPYGEVQGQPSSPRLLSSRGIDGWHQHLADRPGNGLGNPLKGSFRLYCPRDRRSCRRRKLSSLSFKKRKTDQRIRGVISVKGSEPAQTSFNLAIVDLRHGDVSSVLFRYFSKSFVSFS